MALRGFIGADGYSVQDKRILPVSGMGEVLRGAPRKSVRPPDIPISF